MKAESQREEKNEEIRVILFQVENFRFFAKLFDILELIEVGSVRKLPGSKSFLEGLFEYREKILPLYNTRKRLNLSERKERMTLVFHCEETDLAFTIDRPLGTRSVNVSRFGRLKSEVEGIDSKYIKSVLAIDESEYFELDYEKLFIM